jgi:hypothetical protein
VFPNAVLEMAEQFVLLFYVPFRKISLMEFFRYSGGSRNFESRCTPERGNPPPQKKKNV